MGIAMRLGMNVIRLRLLLITESRYLSTLENRPAKKTLSPWV